MINEGGARSSKTYSLSQLMLCKMLENPGVIITVSRKTLPALKATAMRDFLNVLQENELYFESDHNKTEHTYRLFGSEIEFISVDQPQKIRGRKRNILWMNEANEFSADDFKQLAMRTTGQIFMDYNPSDVNSWIYDDIQSRKDVQIIRSTYLDNPFLEKTVVQEIENYKLTDENYWRVFGLGLRGVSEVKIYNNWEFVDELPDVDAKMYGLDFGYNHPTALVEIAEKDDNFYVDELVYRRFMTNEDLIKLMGDLGISKKKIIYADAEDAQRIAEIKRAGYNIVAADKEKGSVKNGIDFIKRHKVYLTKRSVNIHKEQKMYSWKKKDEVILDEPVKINDDGMDATRYPIYTHYCKPKKLSGFI